MNEEHAELCSSPEWASYLHGDVLPPFMALVDLGDDLLEIGPGPGASTAWLRERVERLTVLEIDEDAAGKLASRFVDTNVTVLHGDASAMRFLDESFDSVGCFTMLHHVPTKRLQDQIFAEAFRVLRPGGAFLGSDSLASNDLHDFHAGDTYNPLDPATLLVRLQSAGFEHVNLDVADVLRFVARRPGAEDSGSPPSQNRSSCHEEEKEQLP